MLEDTYYDGLHVTALEEATDDACQNAYEFVQGLAEDGLSEAPLFGKHITYAKDEVKAGNACDFTRSQLIAMMLSFDHDRHLVANCVTELKSRYLTDERESIIKRASGIQG